MKPNALCTGTDSCPPQEQAVAAVVELLVAYNCCFLALLQVKVLNALSCSVRAHVHAFTSKMTRWKMSMTAVIASTARAQARQQ